MNMGDGRADRWDPERYDRYRAERERPAHDLLALVAPSPGGRAADLGCGTGSITVSLHDHVGASETIGIDSSTAMLSRARRHEDDRIRFVEGDLVDLAGLPGRWDVLFANASLQWAPDHDALLPSLVGRLAPRGQLAFQVPANFDHPSHTIADRIGSTYGLEPLARSIDALTPARYAEILWDVGLRELDVSLRIYGVEMRRTDEVLDWVSGTLLTRFESRLDDETFASFRAEYRAELLEALGDPAGTAPYYYAFPRILCRGRLA